jgi:hypothetical protein
MSMNRPSDHPPKRSVRVSSVKSLAAKQDLSFAVDQYDLYASGSFTVRQTHLSLREKGVPSSARPEKSGSLTLR